MERREPIVGRGSGVVAIAVVLTGIGAVALVVSGGGSYETWTALVIAPILFAASLPALRRQAEREGDRLLYGLLVAALILKLLGSLARYYVIEEVYQEHGDAIAYHEDGAEIAANFRSGTFDTGLGSLTGTDFIKVATGVLYTVIGPSKLAGFLFFSWLGFWGMFLCYRAFRLAVPEGRARWYAGILFFLPSLIFWPSSIGKESWLLFAIGMAAFGAARLLTGATGRGLVLTGLGLSATAMVRPHLAAFAGAALVAGYVARKPKAELGQLAPFAKILAVAASVAVLAVLVQRTQQSFVQGRYNPGGGGVRAAAEEISRQTQSGRSEFDPAPIFESPANAPLATFTVLYRPLLIEANNAQAMATAVEASIFILLTLVRLRWLFAGLASLRRRPYVTFAFVFAALSIAALSIVANFGILARQRTLLLPFALVLISVPPRSRRPPEVPAIADTAGASIQRGTRNA